MPHTLTIRNLDDTLKARLRLQADALPIPARRPARPPGSPGFPARPDAVPAPVTPLAVQAPAPPPYRAGPTAITAAGSKPAAPRRRR